MRSGAAFRLAPKQGLGVQWSRGSDALPTSGGPVWDCTRCSGPWGHLLLGWAPANLNLWHVLSQGSLSLGLRAGTQRQRLLLEVGQSQLIWFYIFTRTMKQKGTCQQLQPRPKSLINSNRPAEKLFNKQVTAH